MKGILAVNNEKAVACGLSFRPLSDTIADTLKWYHSERNDFSFAAGLSRERQAELIALTHG
jgi:2'-hydroxyisoflavone reductase